MATLQNVQIFPAIGIARMGNSAEWYLGPELPFPAPPVPPPGGTYKDESCRIKRQAQRFRLWGFFSDGTDRELTLADGKIAWTVHLVNAKPTVTGEGTIDSGVQKLHGAGASASFVGTFGGVSVALGDAETDAEGRLIVRGGFGKSENPTDPSSQPSFPNTPGWYDDVSDGPITATIDFGGTSFHAKHGAWVICPPPRFAPTTYSITTLYDTLRDVAIASHQLPPPGTPSFANDIYPILKRALDMRFVTAFAFAAGDHDTLKVFAPPGGPGDTLTNRQAVFAKLRPAGDMPLLFDGNGTTSQLRDFQLEFMQQWSMGTVTPDWPPAIPTVISPNGLTLAALENCVGAAFDPGIEAGGIPNSISITTLTFAEPFRLDPAHVQAGDVTKGMARPWQGDFMLCTGPESSMSPPDQQSWWPAARPIGIYPADDSSHKRLWTQGVAQSMPEMVKNWHELGFIVDTGLAHPVETEKTNVCKSCFFIAVRSEISSDEAKALHASGEQIKDAFYVVVQGVTPSHLGITTATPSHAQLHAWAPAVTAAPNPSGMTWRASDLALEDASALGQAQRITFGYDVTFSNENAFTAEDVPTTFTASIDGLTSTMVIDLTTRQHPYMVAGPVWWLSADTRVFKRHPGGTFANQTLHNDPNGFIKDVIHSLRNSPHANSWFDALPSDESSQLEWSRTLNHQPIYNFAICRVHYRAEMLPAPDVRVFFRLFPAMTTGTEFRTDTTYRSGGRPGTKIPLLGVEGGEVVTIPFFAEARQAAHLNLNLQKDPRNIDTLKTSVGGEETFGYFGCWLDINQPHDKRFPIQPTPLDGGPFSGPSPLQSIADLIRGTHQCLVAEINFDLDPIAPGATPSSSDKLAQRNLSIDYSDNPGAADTHRVQHPFTIRPATATPAAGQRPDELMIDWGATPHGTVATLYLPGVSASEVMRLADRLYSRNTLVAVDAHSLQMKVAGQVTYVPVPSGGIGDLAGLLTLDLPSDVRTGQKFRVVLHQVVDVPVAQPGRGPNVPRPAIARRQARGAAAGVGSPTSSRRISGAFQFSVLVQTRSEILPIVERAHTNVLRVVGTVPLENRWYPVMQRYLSQLSGRLKALGGGEGRRPGHGDHDRHHEREEREERREFEGKVAGISFDSFGDFEGFRLQTEDGVRMFWSREQRIEALATRAWRERIAILVITEEQEPREPRSLVFLRAPSDDPGRS